MDEIEKMNCKIDDDDDDGVKTKYRVDEEKQAEQEEEEDVPLPGFRFHPTDDELVGFYLRRKVEKRPISIELIKQIDIYKYDPWDLPKGSNVGDKEWYFFCKRGRKYRNSIRPNRVTGSGFWKATGIDRPIYREGRRECIGLKKSLVYYRGSAGKGSKTDWMMHEFRLPPAEDKVNKMKHINNLDDENKPIAQEAEVWTLCRILKRNVSSYKKGMPDWREVTAKRNNMNMNPVAAGDASSQTCSGDSSDHNTDINQGYNISFQNPVIRQNDQKKSFAHHHQFLHQQHHVMNNGVISNQLLIEDHLLDSSISTTTTSQLASSAAASYSSYPSLDINEFSKHGNWDDLRSVVEFAVTDPIYKYEILN